MDQAFKGSKVVEAENFILQGPELAEGRTPLSPKE